jgi:hypothetical protein
VTAPYVIAAVRLLLAAGCAQGIFHWLWKARTMSRWPTVQGNISSSWAVLDGERIKYGYAVGGHCYFGHRIALRPVGGGTSTADPTAQELAEKYPPGSDVTVYYDPRHPASAVLEPRNMQNAVFASVLMFVFGFFGLVFLGLALR